MLSLLNVTSLCKQLLEDLQNKLCFRRGQLTIAHQQRETDRVEIQLESSYYNKECILLVST